MWTHSWLEKEKRENILATAAPSVTQRSRSTPWHRHAVKPVRVLLSGCVNSDYTGFIKPLGSRLKAAGRGCWWMWAERGAAKHTFTHTPSWSLRFQLCNCASVCVCVCHIIYSVQHSPPVLTFCFSSSYNARCWRITSIMIRCHNSGWWDKKKTAELRQHTPDNVCEKKYIIKFRTKTAKIKKIINDFTM